MKYLFLIFFMMISGFAYTQQLSKAEKKAYRQKGTELKKEFREQFQNDPVKFEAYKKSMDSTEQDFDRMSRELADYQSSVQEIERQLTAQRKALEEKERRLLDIKNQIENGKTRTLPVEGSFYAVQSSDIETAKLMEILENTPQPLIIEKDKSGKDIYTLGIYDTHRPAFELKRNLMAMGLKQAFVVAYEDGKVINANVKEGNLANINTGK